MKEDIKVLIEEQCNTIVNLMTICSGLTVSVPALNRLSEYCSDLYDKQLGPYPCLIQTDTRADAHDNSHTYEGFIMTE
ncbi:hypothetical protein DPMN_159021 [Dreissena polymorpha]|uniref:Uncharacterized protein n=1 Tax=Dreissena polymorpha TaxID=45954 RepID=A0A9D4EK01_DREPO|nr:hypothetical protein DPMN_159021 [Dreissena polymorpha]